MRVGRVTSLVLSLLIPVAFVAGGDVRIAGAVVSASHPTVTPSSTPCASSAAVVSGPTHIGRFWGIVRPRIIGPSTGHCLSSVTSTSSMARSPLSVATGAATLVYNSGSLMGTTSGTPVTVTPVFWTPAGYSSSFTAGYESLIEQYLTDVAHDSGSLTNVYSVLQQYTNASSQPINYNIVAGAPIIDTTALPTSGCTPDTGAPACITDSQIQSEVATLKTANGLANDFNHIVIMYLPPTLEACFGAANLAGGGQCSVVGSQGSFCGYHSAIAATNSIYAVMPYAVTPSSGPTCSVTQTPNGNIDADSEISVTSHELSEAMSDPTSGGWFATSNTNEIGDNCNFIFDLPTGGASGAYYDQTINGHHYYTQEEYSNADGTCIQGTDYMVSFDPNGATASVTSQLAAYNTTTALTSNTFTRAGYTFTGWNTISGGGGTAYTNGQNYTFSASTTLYAQWSTNTTDTITFNAEGGSAVSPMSGLDGTTITLPSAPTYAGHTFNGWFVASAGGSALTSPYTLAGSTTLYAQWSVASAVTITVTFDANGGVGAMATESQNYNVGALLSGNAFSRTGYTFVGWNTTPNGTGLFYADGAMYPFSVNVTLYAQWSAQIFTVSFDANGGTGTMTSEMGSANTSSLLNANTFTRTGYTFVGWNSAANGSGAAFSNDASYTFTTSVTLYAQWRSSGPVAQAPLIIVTTSGLAGRPLTLVISGGSGSGAVTFAVTDGTAQGCSITGSVLSVTHAGTCVVVATKASDATYLATSSSDTTILMKSPPPTPAIVVRVTFESGSSALSASDVRALTLDVKRYSAGDVVTITASAWRNPSLSRARALAVERFVLARARVHVVLRETSGRANVAVVVARA